jgi:glycosyltransferase involved in cell wall biosynthesis
VIGNQPLKILFITPYPFDSAPSQRFRFEQYFDILKKNGHQVEQKPFWSSKTWEILYKKGNIFKKFIGLVVAIIKRYLLLFSIHKYSFVFIHREYSPVGFPLAIWMISKVFGKKIIFDFDDAIWIPNVSESNRLFNRFKVYSNTRRIIKHSYKVSCGNEYLRLFASQYNAAAFYNPTTIDTQNYHNKTREISNDRFVIGWTGSHSTVKYLEEIIPVIQKLEKEFNIEFHVISDKIPHWNLNSLKFIPWKKETEVENMLSFSIGIMPLSHDQWCEGKCGFKALQYMALSIPALVSPIGVNTLIVDHNKNGFYCRNEAEWEKYIRQLILDRELLKNLSESTAQKIIENYSVESNTHNFLRLFT